jgi:hypothetical protein
MSSLVKTSWHACRDLVKELLYTCSPAPELVAGRKGMEVRVVGVGLDAR